MRIRIVLAFLALMVGLAPFVASADAYWEVHPANGVGDSPIMP